MQHTPAQETMQTLQPLCTRAHCMSTHTCYSPLRQIKTLPTFNRSPILTHLSYPAPIPCETGQRLMSLVMLLVESAIYST